MPVSVGWPLLQAPLLIVIEGVFLLGAGLFLAALTVHFRDVKDLLSTTLTLWFFGTPVLYSLPEIRSEKLRTLLAFNPVSPLFDAWHDAFFRGRWISPGTWAITAAISLAAFAIGWAFFDRLRDSFPEAV